MYVLQAFRLRGLECPNHSPTSAILNSPNSLLTVAGPNQQIWHIFNMMLLQAYQDSGVGRHIDWNVQGWDEELDL